MADGLWLLASKFPLAISHKPYAMSQSQFASLFQDAQPLLAEVHHVDVLFKHDEADDAEAWIVLSCKPERDGGYSDPLRRKSDADMSRRTCDFIIPLTQLEQKNAGRWPDRSSVIAWDGLLYRASVGGLESHPSALGEGHEAQTVRFFTVESGTTDVGL